MGATGRIIAPVWIPVGCAAIVRRKGALNPVGDDKLGRVRRRARLSILVVVSEPATIG